MISQDVCVIHGVAAHQTCIFCFFVKSHEALTERKKPKGVDMMMGLAECVALPMEFSECQDQAIIEVGIQHACVSLYTVGVWIEGASRRPLGRVTDALILSISFCLHCRIP